MVQLDSKGCLQVYANICASCVAPSLFVRPWVGEGTQKQTGSREMPKSTNRCRMEHLEPRALCAADLAIEANQFSNERFLVQLRDSTAIVRSELPAVQGTKIRDALTDDGWYVVEKDPAWELDAALDSWRSLPQVVQAVPDFRVQLASVPNDGRYESQWSLQTGNIASVVPQGDIDADVAWNYGTSSSVVVAVIDSGIDYRHVDLASNIWVNSDETPNNGVDDDRNGYIDDIYGWNFVRQNNDPMDDNGHGTHVAGTIGAVGNNGIGVAGVVWNVKMMALKFLDASGAGSLSDAIAAIDYARQNGAKIINASWGGGGFQNAVQSAISRFQSAGGIFVAAAGNDSSDNGRTPSFPANYNLSHIISVAASTSANTLASFSNYGSNVDIAAPGSSILSTMPNNRYGYMSGTSMAAPHVAGAIALLWGQKPTATAAELIDLVMKSADSFEAGATQHGRLNLGKAATLLRGSSFEQPSEDQQPAPSKTQRFDSMKNTAIPDASRRRASNLLVPIDVTSTATIADIDVVLDIGHSYIGDLRIYLVSPDGTTVSLINRRGASRDELKTVLDDESNNSVSTLNRSPVERVRPESTLGAFDGKLANGRWYVLVQDAARGDSGLLRSVSLVVTFSDVTAAPASASGSQNAYLVYVMGNQHIAGSWSADDSSSIWGSDGVRRRAR